MVLGEAVRGEDVGTDLRAEADLHLHAGALVLDRLALLVEPVEGFGDTVRLDGIVGGEQAAAERGIADAAAGVDARADEEGEMEGVDRLADARDADQRPQPRILLPAYGEQPLDDEGAVDAGERDDVAHRRQRDEIEPAEQVGRRPARRRRAQGADSFHERQEDDAGGAEMALPGKIVLPVGIDDRDGRRQRTADLVVVEHDDVCASLIGRRDRRSAVGAAVDGDNQGGAARGEIAHRLGIGSVALEDPIGDVDLGVDAVVAEEAFHQSRRRGAVDVVVAEDGDAFAPPYRFRDARRSFRHVGKAGGIGQEVADRRIEKARRVVCQDPAAGEHAGDKITGAVALRDRQRNHLLPVGKPVLPGQPGRRAADVEEIALFRRHFLEAPR